MLELVISNSVKILGGELPVPKSAGRAELEKGSKGGLTHREPSRNWQAREVSQLEVMQ